MLVTLLLIILYFVILLSFFALLNKTIRNQKYTYKNLFSICFLAVVLIVCFLFPGGVINYKKFESKNVIVAFGEGAANCSTIILLKEDNRFIERNICFGSSQIKGNFEIINDTIYFKNVDLGNNEDTYSNFAVISKVGKKRKLIRYTITEKDTLIRPINITEYHLN
tara:strand:- start:20573 stop:21070 length:498 start_codon:yes stop_codon:yes gene_type:complete